MKKLIFTFSLFACSLLSVAQDYLIKLNGEKLNCKITNEDSTKVYFTISKNGRAIETFFEKDKVKSINYGKTFNDSQNKNRLSLSLGPSYAVGDFGDDDQENDKSGLACSGVNLNLYYSYRIHNFLGIGLKFFGNINGYNGLVLLKQLSNSENELECENSPWISLGILAGMNGFIQDQKTIIEFRALAGIVFLNSPEVKIRDINTLEWVKMETARASTFGYDMGLNITRLFSDHWSLSAGINYLNANFRFGNINLTSSNGNKEESKDVEQSFSIVNFTAGIGFNF